MERIREMRERLERERLERLRELRQRLIREVEENKKKKYEDIKNNLPESTKVNEIELKKMKDSNHEKCIICLNDFIINDNIKHFPCSHFFHEDCIIKWFLEKNSCPLCKKTYNYGNNNLYQNDYLLNNDIYNIEYLINSLSIDNNINHYLYSERNDRNSIVGIDLGTNFMSMGIINENNEELI